jgi:hypothetical protein
VLVGPLSGDEYSEIVFPVLSPDPNKDKNVKFLKYAVHAGGNRGRGQVYPTGKRATTISTQLARRARSQLLANFLLMKRKTSTGAMQ